MENRSQNQRERLNYIEFRVFFTGQFSRSDLVQRFGISKAGATRDLAIYQQEAPANIEFDGTTKNYRIAKSFQLHYLKEVEPKQMLRALVHGLGNDFGAGPEHLVPCELPTRLQAPPVEVLAAISRAINQGRVLSAEYLSGTGNYGRREIVPFSIFGTGLKWMVRAYNRRRNLFCDFILNRFKSAEVLEEKPRPEEAKEFDDEWNRMLKLELIPHPAASPDSKAVTLQEFQMTDGALVLRVRAALAPHVLNLWRVDCSQDQHLTFLPLCLRNLVALHDVDAAIAPGFGKTKST